MFFPGAEPEGDMHMQVRHGFPGLWGLNGIAYPTLLKADAGAVPAGKGTRSSGHRSSVE